VTRLDRINEVCRELGDVELDVALTFLERLYAGQNAYGRFKPTDPRDFRKEAEDEALDMAVYCARELHRKRKG